MYVIGFDYGRKRMGIAVGQTVTATARPLTTLAMKNHQADWTPIHEIIREWRPQALVVGLPKHEDDSEHPLADAIYQFGQQLQEHYRLPVYLIDEHLSSYAATQENFTVTKKFKKNQLDAVAARIILETWFAEQCS